MAEGVAASRVSPLLVLRAPAVGMPGSGGGREVLVARCGAPGGLLTSEEGLLYRAH